MQTFAEDIYSQNTRLSLKLSDAKLDEVLDEIEELSEFYFLFNEKLINTERKVSVSAENQIIDKVLDEIFNGEDVVYTITDRKIILVPEFLSGNARQEITIKGKVTDSEGNPLPGVNVVEKGTTNGAVTDLDGAYTITVSSSNATLSFSFIGYLTEETQLDGQSSLNMTLIEDIMSLEEVVVIGYGTVKRSDLTGSVGSVEGDNIAAIPTSNFLQSMAGQVSGVNVMQASGAPGAGISVQIRGANSIEGSNEPLYVIDGVFISDTRLISNQDIESVEILKDASATAIYGSRGANGVVLITTKQGKAGKTIVDFTIDYGFQQLTKKLDLMNAEQYARFYNQQATNDGISAYFTEEEINNFGEGFDWQDLVFDIAPELNTSFTVSGGKENTRFSVSTNVRDQQGIVKGSGYQRYSLRTKLDHKINKIFSVETTSILTKEQRDRERSTGAGSGDGLFSAAIVAPPTLTPYNEDGSYRLFQTDQSFVAGAMVNPLNFLNEDIQTQNANSLISNLALIFEPLPDLKLKIFGSIEYINRRDDTYRTTKFQGSSGSAGVSTSDRISYMQENTLSYEKTFNEIHRISAVAGVTFEETINETFSASGSGFLNDKAETYSLQSASTLGTPYTGYSKYAIHSILGRANYVLKDKYFFTASIRRDGSSKYSPGQKWSTFPSMAIAWRVSEEPFLKNSEISNLKLRAGWGLTGSQAINPYQTLTTLNTGQTVFGNNLYVYYAPSDIYPGNLKWETTEQVNFGIDFAILDNRLRATADLYLKETRDLLNPVSLPSSYGYETTIKNVGKVQNKGLEIGINTNLVRGEFNWDINANFSMNRSEVLELYDGQDILFGSVGQVMIQDNAKIMREGEPMGVFYGFVTDGYDENGYEKYKDINSDGVINADDKTIIGDPNPNFIAGLNSYFSYKNLELSIFINGTYGNDMLNMAGISSTIDYQRGMNMLADVYGNTWTIENPDAKYPKVSTFSTARYSDRQIENGSYLRLRQIQLSYNFPLRESDFLNNVQIYVRGINLLTLTNYSWWDPEINIAGQGVNQLAYPVAKTYSMGVRLSF